jgi:peptidoglycan lytic transglycosylase
MPLRHTIGVSLALLMASAGAMAKSPDKSTPLQEIAGQKDEPASSAKRCGPAPSEGDASPSRSPTRLAIRRDRRSRYDVQHFTEGSAPEDSDWVAMHTTGYLEFGDASWYDLVGSRTANGEWLDTETPTAAHRTLPLGSIVKVTDLDTGRSVIVRINDRGPWRRRFIIDLSPRAAEELGMVRSGVAAVMVERVTAGTNVAANPLPAIFSN